MSSGASRCSFIPPYLLQRLAFSDLDVRVSRACHATLAVDAAMRARREEPGQVTPGGGWTVYTAGNTSDLPGTPARSAGQPPANDVAVDEAYDWLAASLGMLGEVFGRASYDGRGAHVVATVHFERNYVNAFWDGTQLVFGDGDGRVFDRFTKPVDVLAHELMHGVVQHTAGLVYRDQPGALNESLCDVFGAMVKQRTLGQTADEADWLVGQGLFLPSVRARALRDMARPGTAYDDPVLGRDPQGDSMDSYIETTDDNGGVHLNSGIPNRAFHLAATALGGPSWQSAGPVWYSALTSGLSATADFAAFAEATVAAAPAGSAAAIQEAWETVGVLGDAAGARPPSRGAAADLVAVCRTGGFAGIRTYGEVRLGPDPRTREVQDLVSRLDLTHLSTGQAMPDRFVYEFTVCGQSVTVPEQDLTPELARLARVVLEG